MFHSIKSKLISAILVMVVLLGALIYVTWAQMSGIEQTLTDLEQLQDVKSHVLIPQKDMNQFIAQMEATVLFIELGDDAGAQEAYEGSVDAEQDISAEFEYLELNAPEALLPQIEQAHQDWEIAVEYMKVKAEALAAEKDVSLLRPATELKVASDHVAEGVQAKKAEFAQLSYAELEGLMEDDATNPVEIADEGIDVSEEKTDEYLASERAAGEKAVKDSASSVLIGSLAVLFGIVLTGGVVTSSVSRPLSSLKQGAEKIAGGDLDYGFKNVPNDEVGAVINSVESMAHGLKGRIRNLEELAGIVMVTGDDISAEATKAKAAGADVEGVLAKAEQLKGLAGQMLDSTRS